MFSLHLYGLNPSRVENNFVIRFSVRAKRLINTHDPNIKKKKTKNIGWSPLIRRLIVKHSEKSTFFAASVFRSSVFLK